jgi:hypothetical protein
MVTAIAVSAAWLALEGVAIAASSWYAIAAMNGKHHNEPRQIRNGEPGIGAT